jgi:hypothetical protein
MTDGVAGVHHGRVDLDAWPPLAEGIDDLPSGPFRVAYLAPPPTAAYAELIGPGRWQPRADMGESVVVRFPAEDERANAGYHLAAPARRPPNDRPGRRQCPGRLRAGRLRPLAGGPGHRHRPDNDGLAD